LGARENHSTLHPIDLLPMGLIFGRNIRLFGGLVICMALALEPQLNRSDPSAVVRGPD